MTLPTEIDELDALRLENKSLKLARAQEDFQRELARVAEKYQFDPMRDGFDATTRRIVRAPRSGEGEAAVLATGKSVTRES